MTETPYNRLRSLKHVTDKTLKEFGLQLETMFFSPEGDRNIVYIECSVVNVDVFDKASIKMREKIDKQFNSIVGLIDPEAAETDETYLNAKTDIINWIKENCDDDSDQEDA